MLKKRPEYGIYVSRLVLAFLFIYFLVVFFSFFLGKSIDTFAIFDNLTAEKPNAVPLKEHFSGSSSVNPKHSTWVNSLIQILFLSCTEGCL